MPGLRHLIQRRFNSVSWRNPVLKALFQLLDPLDAAARSVRNLRELPRYSARVRSNGLPKQFGGQQFAYYGNLLAELLQTNAYMKREDRVLEIGCGCGRTAIALTRFLAPGNYTGVDIDPVSITACLRNPTLKRMAFDFQLLDVFNPIWNPESDVMARDYRFPFPDGSFDLIFLISVFTHILPADLSNYVAEIGRMIAPTGRVLVTTFLMDHGTKFDALSFPFAQDGYWVHNQAIPEKAIGYPSAYLEAVFRQAGLALAAEPLLGTWRQVPEIEPATRFSQDTLVFTPNGNAG